MKPENHYEVLGISRGSQPADIVIAHREALTRAYQQTPRNPDGIAAIREAHRVLTDENERSAYDATLPPPRIPRVTRASQRAIATDDGEEKPSWIKWACIALFVAACIGWWTSRKPPRPVPVGVSSQAIPVSSAPAAVERPTSVANEDSPKTAAEVFSMVGAGVGRVEVFRGGSMVGTGSGVVIAGETIITNCHVVMQGPGSVPRFVVGRRSATAELLVADEELDLCKLRVAGLQIPPVSISSVSSVHNGQTVYAIGAPGGGPVVVTEGTVTALHGITAGNVIQTTAAVSPGSSGGGLFSVTGKLIGIVTFQQRGLEQRNYAIPVDWLGRMETRAGSGQADQVVPPVYMPPN